MRSGYRRNSIGEGPGRRSSFSLPCFQMIQMRTTHAIGGGSYAGSASRSFETSLVIQDIINSIMMQETAMPWKDGLVPEIQSNSKGCWFGSQPGPVGPCATAVTNFTRLL